MNKLTQISVGTLLLLSSVLADSASGAKPASLAVLIRAEEGSEPLAGNLQPLLEMEAARQWPGTLVERAELDRLLAELAIAATRRDGREDGGGDGLLQLGKLSRADCLLTARVTAEGVRATITRLPTTEVVHEQIYRRRLEPDSLAVRIVTDALKAYRRRDRDPRRPRVSVGSFYYADPHRRFFEFSQTIGVQLREKLAKTEDVVLAERLFPSELLSEFELARNALTAHVARNLSAPPADVLLYGEFQPRPDQELDSKAAVLDCTLVALSPTGLCRRRKVDFSCRSDEPQSVVRRAMKLIEQSAAEVPARLAAGGKRRFSQKEFEAFKAQAFKLMPSPPQDDGVFYRRGGYRGPVQFAKPEDLQRVLRMLECAMLFKGDDTQVLVCTGAALDGLARSGKHSPSTKTSLLETSLELIERAYRLESNWNTRGMYWRFCMSGSRSPAQRPPRSLEAARQIWNTRQTEAWHAHQIHSAFSTLFAAEANPERQQAMFLRAAPEYAEKEDGLRDLLWLFGAFTKRVSASDGDPETLRQARAAAQRMLAERSALLRSLGHLLFLAVCREMGESQKGVGVPAEFAEHFRAAVGLVPELHDAYGEKFAECPYSDQLSDFFETYEKVVQKHGLSDDVAACMEQYVDAQMRAGNHDWGGLPRLFRALLPRMWESRKYARAHELVTEFLEHYTFGGSADYDRMWLARQRNRFASAMHAEPPPAVDRLEKIEFDDDQTGWVTKLAVSDNALFGIRSARSFLRGRVFRTPIGARQANVLHAIDGDVRDLACSRTTVAVGTDSRGFYLIDSRTLTVRRLTPEDSGLPSLRTRLVCNRGEDFFVAMPDKENLYSHVYHLQPGATRISRTETKLVPHIYWRMKANTLQEDASPVLPQTWQHRTAVADGKTLEFTCGHQNHAVQEVTISGGREAPLLRYRGFELNYVFDFVQWQGQFIFATGNGLYTSKPGSNEIRCLLSEPDLLFFCLCPLDDRMYVGTSDGLYSFDADLFVKMLEMK